MDTLSILKHYFGYPSFRGGQETLINDVIGGRDVLGIMPTGAGKSICYQVPALALEGIALVVSPLISLMQDQVMALKQAGVPAAFFNSSLSAKQMDLALSRACQGQYKLIYVAPERLMTPRFLAFAQSTNISMVAVDEAHCISQWGQDFRPSYGQIPQFIASLPRRPVVCAFTATATERVKEDIVGLLALREPQVLVTGFDRENLYFEVQQPKKKLDGLLQFLAQNKGQSGIVYCATRKTVEEVCIHLNERRYHATRYHAGLSDEERRRNQEAFLYDQIPIMVATNAFGMGIDKSNVSFVVHYNMPKDLESYYQEAGRAGRDGAPAQCLLLYSGQDVRTAQWMIEHGREAEAADPETAQLLIERDKERLKQMTFYSTTGDCLRRFILRYFGERPPQSCGHCGNCLGANRAVQTEEHGTVSAKQPAQRHPLTMGEEALYHHLLAVRRTLANQHGVPPFVVFGDATLQAMCQMKPTTKQAFLKVPGVGEVKLEHYGAVFLKEIKGFIKDTGMVVEETQPKRSPKKQEGVLPTAAVCAQIPISQEPVQISALAATINAVLREAGCQGVSAPKLNRWLMDQGYVMERENVEGTWKIPTQKGIYAGITVVERVHPERTYSVSVYSEDLQREIIAHLPEIVQG